jgi:UTP:GlnB (protein PII) uridylyltransferase
VRCSFLLAVSQFSRHFGESDIYQPEAGLMIDDATIARAAGLLQKAAPEALLILIGSYARRNPNEHSDLDLLVVKPLIGNDWFKCDCAPCWRPGGCVARRSGDI